MGIDYPYQKFKSARLRANLATAALAISALIMILSVVEAYAANRLIDAVLGGGTVPEGILTASDEMQQHWGRAWATMRIITAITFLTWIYRASQNLQALGNEAQEHSPKMAVIWWFVPVAHLAMPYRVMKEIWVGSNPHPRRCANLRMSRLIGPWWAAWICNVLVLSAGSVATQDDTLEAIRTLNTLNMTSDTIGVVAAALAIIIVREITSNQEKSYKVRREHR